MPNIKSAKKRVKVIEKKTLRNNMIQNVIPFFIINFVFWSKFFIVSFILFFISIT